MVSKDFEELFSNETLKNIFIFFHNNQEGMSNEDIDEAVNKLCRQCGMDYNKCSNMNYKDLLKKCSGFREYFNKD